MSKCGNHRLRRRLQCKTPAQDHARRPGSQAGSRGTRGLCKGWVFVREAAQDLSIKALEDAKVGTLASTLTWGSYKQGMTSSNLHY